MMTERPRMARAMPEMPTMPGTTGMSMPVPNMMMVPRCKMTFEKCADGMKIHCVCDDATTAAMLQNLCAMNAGGMCSCCMLMNGMTVCCCNMTMAMCKCETTKMGVTISCTSGDKDCCAMIQACCDCCTAMCKAGCTCCLMMNGMVCCCCC